MEHKSSREKAWVASKNKNNNQVISGDNLSDEINNLQDDSFVELEEGEEEKVPLTEEEKLVIRKKIGALLCGVIIVFIFLIIVLIFDPFAPKKDNDDDGKIDEEVIQEKITLYDYEDGEINLNDKYISQMYDEIELKTYDFYEFDTYFMFANSVNKISSFTDLQKAFFVTKSSEFTTLMTKISTSESICDQTISIDTNTLSSIASERYNSTVSIIPSFKYNYYYNKSYVASINFKLENDKYIGTCYKSNKVADKVVFQDFIKATKKGDYVYIDVVVAFANKNGVYKDPNYKELITSDREANREEYLKNANTYRYTFVVDEEDGYYLDNISLIK